MVLKLAYKKKTKDQRVFLNLSIMFPSLWLKDYGDLDWSAYHLNTLENVVAVPTSGLGKEASSDAKLDKLMVNIIY